MSVRTYLEEALENIVYEDLGEWCVPNISKYSIEKSLFSYQVEAVKNAIKALNCFYRSGSVENGKRTLLNLCCGQNASIRHLFDVKEEHDSTKNAKFLRLKDKFTVDGNVIDGLNFFNRICFWMATASGKTLVLIKLIEIIDYLQQQGLMPKKNMMTLFPSEKIQNQFAEAVDEYNVDKDRPIRLLSLKEYEDEQHYGNMDIDIKVYSYRSDLLSDQEKSKKVDTVTYDNNGNWYIFMDEAHKGDKDDSLRQDYITIMSRNGFLFNFSATFTDDLDFAATCFNFNLEKFIESGYGKNVYLSRSRYTFQRKSDDFSVEDKQLQVLKSLVTLSLVKSTKECGYYHNPLMVTLVNEVNTKKSDADLFFAELAKIARGEVNADLINQAKRELYAEFSENSQFQFGTESLNLVALNIRTALDRITLATILKDAFNVDSPGMIEVVEGEKGKEFALKLATADKPFALFRIGDASQYIKEKLKDGYLIVRSFEERCYFDELNSDSGAHFNMLIGSRMFYEGWDSNRPNVMNFINIGMGDAKKFVLQSLGRGVRIEPIANNRQRLKANDIHKRPLLETLFVFATNRAAVETILETMDTQKAQEKNIELQKADKIFDLLIPIYKEEEQRVTSAQFKLSSNAYERLKKYVGSFSDNLLCLLCNIHLDDVARLRKSMERANVLFSFDQHFDYKDMPTLLQRIARHLTVHDKTVCGIKELEEEIIHFKHIKIVMDKWNTADESVLKDFISNATAEIDYDDLLRQLRQGKITKQDYVKRITNSTEETKVKDLCLKKVSQHYYLPVILSEIEKVDYIKHIINVESEVNFVNNLLDYIKEKQFEYEWMFSKIDQTIDDKNIAIPYFNNKDNLFHDFYPDFIFWQKKDNDYRITFVDPKGTEYTSYLSKIDYFEKLFYEGDKPKIFKYKNYNVQFDLKLVYDGMGNTIPAKYMSYWMNNNDFSWLK